MIPAADGVLGTPFVVPAVAAGGFAKSCVAGNGAINAGGTTVRVGEPLSCTVTVTAPATGIAGGTATVTLTNALFISGTNIATFTCGTAIAACTSLPRSSTRRRPVSSDAEHRAQRHYLQPGGRGSGRRGDHRPCRGRAAASSAPARWQR
ncbi:MAG: hypothetical protein U0531_11535 [Dehalococcoidia bacterium]